MSLSSEPVHPTGARLAGPAKKDLQIFPVRVLEDDNGDVHRLRGNRMTTLPVFDRPSSSLKERFIGIPLGRQCPLSASTFPLFPALSWPCSTIRPSPFYSTSVIELIVPYGSFWRGNALLFQPGFPAAAGLSFHRGCMGKYPLLQPDHLDPPDHEPARWPCCCCLPDISCGMMPPVKPPG